MPKSSNWVYKASFATPSKDRLFLGGIIRELLLIGEAANAISSQTKALISLPWKEVVGMRNQLIHAYFDINHKILWITATEDIPRLIAELEKFLEEYSFDNPI